MQYPAILIQEACSVTDLFHAKEHHFLVEQGSQSKQWAKTLGLLNYGASQAIRIVTCIGKHYY